MRIVAFVVLAVFIVGCGGSPGPTTRKRKRRKSRPRTPITHVSTPKTPTTPPKTEQSSEKTGKDEYIPREGKTPVGVSKELWDAWKSFQKDYLNWRKKYDAMLDKKLTKGESIPLNEINSMLSETRSLQQKMHKVRGLAESLRGKDALAESVLHEIDRDAAVNLGRAIGTLLDWRAAGN